MTHTWVTRPRLVKDHKEWMKAACKDFNARLRVMTSSNGNIFRVTGPLCREFTGHRWIPHHKSQWRGALIFSLICFWINAWVNNREADDLRRHCPHYDVIVMVSQPLSVEVLVMASQSIVHLKDQAIMTRAGESYLNSLDIDVIYRNIHDRSWRKCNT